MPAFRRGRAVATLTVAMHSGRAQITAIYIVAPVPEPSFYTRAERRLCALRPRQGPVTQRWEKRLVPASLGARTCQSPMASEGAQGTKAQLCPTCHGLARTRLPGRPRTVTVGDGLVGVTPRPGHAERGLCTVCTLLGGISRLRADCSVMAVCQCCGGWPGRRVFPGPGEPHLDFKEMCLLLAGELNLPVLVVVLPVFGP
jgi:hypothetical protein